MDDADGAQDDQHDDLDLDAVAARLTAWRQEESAHVAWIVATLQGREPDAAALGLDERQVSLLRSSGPPEMLRLFGMWHAQHVDDADAALRRIAGGTYGTCSVCGRRLSRAVLRDHPCVHTCPTCGLR